MLAAPAPGTQWVYVTIKQLVSLSSQSPFKCSITGPPERARTIPCQHEPGSRLLKKPHCCLQPANRAYLKKIKCSYQEAVLGSHFCGSRSPLFKALLGLMWVHAPNGGCYFIYFGHGLMYYKCRQKVRMGLLAAGFGSSSQGMQRTVDRYSFCEFIPK